MEICLTIEGKTHCYGIPEVLLPMTHWKPGPGPVNYPAFLQDAMIVASLRAESHKITDPAVRERLMTGYNEALQAIEKRAGPGVEIRA
ncbi:hypothetical protein EOS_32235 [Caballeronia mineralivorans PML1(12)]|uniref:Uncharacterized protein n=1 Tax=Caballeronia mineralivorans PML1(12) TaxID=908627 RepID=A0A0J1CN35_9BURK|nr:hypothetical protein EOS_32235 [Caballeronia mineralivorans PML1(12)]